MIIESKNWKILKANKIEMAYYMRKQGFNYKKYPTTLWLDYKKTTLNCILLKGELYENYI